MSVPVSVPVSVLGVIVNLPCYVYILYVYSCLSVSLIGVDMGSAGVWIRVKSEE